uniref:Uncharacterized protein LOC104230037 n=1 Tax=Nicotiana sylvestris TaxID=4096 RepID=A0A1U7WR60_NICSY|nr:PREDICTED: uncharacterized protein LOC104230037 [Nicotiana sylvestris]
MDIRLGVTANKICNTFCSVWVFFSSFLVHGFLLCSFWCLCLLGETIYDERPAFLLGCGRDIKMDVGIVDVSLTFSTTNTLAEKVQHCKVARTITTRITLFTKKSSKKLLYEHIATITDSILAKKRETTHEEY